MNLPYMGLYASGAASVVIGASLTLSANFESIVAESSTADNNPVYNPLRQSPSNGLLDTFIRNSAGAIIIDSPGVSGISDSIKRVTSSVDSGSNIKIYKNSVQGSSDNYIRSGVLTATNTTIGALVRLTTSDFVNMNYYGRNNFV